MRVGSTDGKGASSFTGTFESAVSLLCGSIRSRFSHVAAAHRQKKVQCVSGMFVGVVGAYLSNVWSPDRPAHDPHNPAFHPDGIMNDG